MECDEMEDKTFELMTKMYSEMTARFDSVDARFDSVEKKLDEKADKADIVLLENKIDANFKALFDGYKQTYEKLSILESKVDDINSKVERQDAEIRVIKSR
jgi:tetrahydromethanopterin S-methyltransferase subunit G